MSSISERPSQADWKKNRELISCLYSRCALKEVRRMMMDNGFKASPRMYRQRFKEWGVAKNISSTQKEELLRQTEKLDQAASRSLLCDVHLGEKELRNLARYSKAMSRVKKTKENCPMQSKFPGNDTFKSRQSRAIQLPSPYLPGLVHDGFVIARPEEAAGFWEDIKQAIYLVKTPSIELAWPVLHKACEKASAAFASDVVALLREIFASLSPTNTRQCPEIRLQIIDYLRNLAAMKLGELHPITVILQQLQFDSQSRDVTERCLSYIVDILSSEHRTPHPEALKVEMAIVRLLRHDAEYDQALLIGQRLWYTARNIHGTRSLEARAAARELEHVYVDTENFQRALDVCLSIVGHEREATDELVRRGQLDKCAVYTMEDIAAIYERMGSTDLNIVWLQEALKGARLMWEESVVIAHICDKLNSTPSRYGR
ncbi:uncharacterized protein PAC_19010 [Phialocephala subalpina]|uniref:Clr5 domain-containing protein n=1 Tax=Phialocephala subalpina TaxID=576137 RepID=A0A1L7XVU2_9HELO|nr:uncharacterized protein PAC_19010 [Phialocephala subalpina]